MLTYPIAGGDDEVVLPGEEPEVAVFVLNAPVTSEVVITTEGIGCGGWVLTVTLLSAQISDRFSFHKLIYYYVSLGSNKGLSRNYN